MGVPWSVWLVVAVVVLSLVSCLLRSSIRRLASRLHEIGRDVAEKTRSPGYADVKGKLALYKRLCKTVTGDEGDQIRRSLHRVNDGITRDSRIFGVMVPQFGYATAWGTLHEVRNQLCKLVAQGDDTHSLIHDIELDKIYLPSASEAIDFVSSLHRLQAELDDPVIALTDGARLRRDLKDLSERVGDARTTLWGKADLKRDRLTHTGVLLAIAAVVGVVVLGGLGRHPFLFFLSLAVFGALGGLLSSFHAAEPLGSNLIATYINRRVLYLRPIVGSVLALLSYLAIQANAVSVLHIQPNDPSEAFLFVGAFAGFSQRFFLDQLFKLPKSESDQ